MNFVHVFGIALGVSLDCAAVAAAAGLAAPDIRAAKALRIGSFFGVFQVVMPVLGWFCASWFARMAYGFGHWIAFALLVSIGIKMIYESLRFRKNPLKFDPANIRALLALSLATSLDSLAAGAGLSVLGYPIVAPALIMGCTAFVLSVAGVYVGRRFGTLLESRVEIVGGVIIVVISVRILLSGMGAI